MRRATIDIVLFLICVTFPQKVFTQNSQQTDEICGSATIEVGPNIQDFKIPATGQVGFSKETKCSYQLTSPKDTRIEFMINKMHVGTGGNCIENYINVSDTSSGIKNAKYYACGTKMPQYPFKSSSNTAFIEFSVKQDLDKSFIEGTLIAKPLFDPACGPLNLTLQGTSSTLTIPAAGNKFTGPTICFYLINGNVGTQLYLEFTKFTLGNDGQCKEDYIKLASSEKGLETSNYTYCGTKIPTTKFISANNQIYIVMSSYNNAEKTSIIATYGTVNFVSKLESSAMVVYVMLALVSMC